MADLPPFDPSSWPGQAASLLGAGGVGMLLLELVKRLFARADKQDDDAKDYRKELRDEIRELNARCDVLTSRLDESRNRENALFSRCTSLEAENVGLRSRYHRLLNYVQAMIGAVEIDRAERGLPPLTSIPTWIDETVPGPTARPDQPKPPEPTP